MMKYKIFDAKSYDERIPTGFAAAKVRIDGGLKSDLSWNEAREAAWRYIEEGQKIFWELDLGIFSGLKHPLTHTSQFLSLKLSVNHFRDVFWREFGEHTIGISLFKGSVDFTEGYLWDKEQENNLRGWLEDFFGDIDHLNSEVSGSHNNFSAVDHKILAETEPGKKLLQLYCRDATAEYIDILVNQLPEDLEAFVLLDTEAIDDPVHLATLMSKDHFPHVSLVVKGNSIPPQEWSWENTETQNGFFGREFPSSESQLSSQVALCLPALAYFKPSDYGTLGDVITHLSQREKNYRIIPEGLLTTEWEGLDYLIVSENHLSPQGKRMLMGFCAAGGTVVRTGEEPMGLPQEISMDEFLLNPSVH